MRFLVEQRKCHDLREPIGRAFISEEMKDRNLYNYDDFIEFYDLEECELEQERDDDYGYHLENRLEERKTSVDPIFEPAGPPS